MSHRRPFSLTRHLAARAAQRGERSLTLRGEPAPLLKAALWPGTPRWIKELALNVRGAEIRGLPVVDGLASADGFPATDGWCLLYTQILGASLTALGEPWTPWPCALYVERAGLDPAWWIGLHPALPSVGPAVRTERWAGHMMIATSGWLVDVGLPAALIRELHLEPVWIWKQEVLELEPAITIQPEEDLRWQIAHPVAMPPNLEVLAPEKAARIGGQFAAHLRRYGFPGNRENCWWPADVASAVRITRSAR